MYSNHRLQMKRLYENGLYAKRAKVADTINKLRKVLPPSVRQTVCRKTAKFANGKINPN